MNINQTFGEYFIALENGAVFSTVLHNSAPAQKKRTVPRYAAARFPIRPIRREGRYMITARRP
jgi:hypothetical protein